MNEFENEMNLFFMWFLQNYFNEVMSRVLKNES